MRIALIAGEASGDRLGAALVAGFRDLGRTPDLVGVGGDELTAAGLDSLFPMRELSVMGLAEVLPRYPHLRRRMLQTVRAVLEARPDVLVTIDSPDFCLRVAARVRAAAPDIRIVHYVAPSVWAWRPGRAARMAPFVDQVLALLPFEPPYMEAAGMRCDFVGHPVAAESAPPARDVAAFRAAHRREGPLLLALPGSRGTEVSRLAPVFGAALERLRAVHPGMRVVVPAAAHVADTVGALASRWPIPATILPPGNPAAKRAAFAAADAALAASGTVSLELAAAGTPMVIGYDASFLSWQIISRMIRTDTVTLVNLVDGTRTVPEFLGPACTADRVARGMATLLADSAAQRLALGRAMTALGRGGEPPGVRAARAVLDGLRADSPAPFVSAGSA